MSIFVQRLSYWRRIFKVYFTKNKGYLSFWHETPAMSEEIAVNDIKGPYYMTFRDKADYGGPKDKDGVILFDYYFDIGRQYNPLAVAQYGLGHYNLYLKTGDKKYLEIAKIQADWLVKNLEKNDKGLAVWKHKFRWHYKQYLSPGWYSAHSQGTGISLLGRIYKETGEQKYLEAARQAFISMNVDIKDGGVKFTDNDGNIWLEEYIIDSPTHILNGFLWALWGVWDYCLLTGDKDALNLWNNCVKTLKENLPKYDAGFWSLYDLSKQFLKMIASPFYHDLHIVQLKIMHLISKEDIFDSYRTKFQGYKNNRIKRKFAFIYKAIFKIFYF
ncbi:MAG: D-glucuronyl C5-epimerase [Candidatus Wolfebacteria bacterium GW2011_GWA1_44_24]|uniref:D-glucuronyl C5-epimerase n=1 Tax=Candidatus Wolfebacteria bacterium GW2011_GWB1_41_12 TaxID=1619006 RepID=A0A0G0UK44_9BACT|nr:MAG: D-glucuronyl C5-epimerase [Candidatus Wolfebacteria bacterium GW2011_GWB1_41_12]KKT56659.1 MAG: D-glucuronyl C5-epimerase [Candidatus Wolfebacteria bacterium GW2011_GWA1_44_24]